jgi:hypothetical protein
MIKSLLISAYKSSNPQATLEGSLIDHPTQKMVNVLVPQTIDLNKADECDLMKDIMVYLEQCKESCSPIAWRSRFIYFATSMCHVFGSGDFFPDPTCSIIAYIEPNKPMPYLWLDLDEEARLSLIGSHNVNNPGFKVVIHTITGVNSLKSRHYTCGERTDNPEAMQISLRLDLYKKTADALIARLAKPHPEIDCVVMLTFRMRFSGIYYKSKHPLIVNLIKH